MANYQWVGGTGNTTSKYNWNVASNWRRRTWNGSQWVWTVSNTIPGFNDVAGVGSVFSASLTCHSPLLYGGFSGGVSGGYWDDTTSGHTFNSALASLKVQIDQDYQATYPFRYMGGGITGEVYDWVISTPATGSSGEYLAGLSGISFSIANEKTQSLKIKTQEFAGSLGNPEGLLQCVFVKNYSHVDGSTGAASGGQGATNASIISNLFSLSNAGTLVVNGGAWASFNLFPNYSTGITSNPQSYIKDTVCKEIKTKSHTFFFDNSVIAGKVHVMGGNFSPLHDMRFTGTIDMNAVLSDAYPAGGATGGLEVNDSALVLDETSTYGARYPLCPFIFGDYEGKGTSKAGQIIVKTSTQPSSGPVFPCPWSLEFAGDSKVNFIRSTNSTICASAQINPNSKVEIGTIVLDKSSFLDFGAYSPFDGWYIGSPTGNAGGIFFDDESSTVVGSKGLRLWSSQSLLGGRVDNRLSTVIKNPVKGSMIGDAADFV